MGNEEGCGINIGDKSWRIENLMKIIPTYISKANRRRSEMKVHAPLTSLTGSSESDIAFHSLNLAEHSRKRMAELDFVLVSTSGIVVLEVKGGGVACDSRGWTSTDRFDRTHTIEDPFEQARTGMFSLMNSLGKILSDDKLMKSVNFGHAVVFPDCFWNEQSPEWNDQMYLDKNGLGNPDHFSSFNKFFRYWREKNRIHRELPIESIKKLIQAIRPTFDVIPSLGQRIHDIESTIGSRTDEQFFYLDVIESNDRVFCTGGAGTGKTLLAVESARRGAAGGADVLLACRSPVLAEYLSDSLLDCPDVTVTHAGQLTEDDEVSQAYDMLILDDAQDLFTVDYFLRLDSLLKGGFDSGMWRVFCDPNAQSTFYRDYDKSILEHLKQLDGVVKVPLSRNRRNTKNIVTQTKLVTAADMGTAAVGEGPPVQWEYCRDRDEVALKLEEKLSELTGKDVLPGDIAILSPLPFASSSVSLLPAQLQNGIEVLSQGATAKLNSQKILFSTIEDFKGLERSYVLALDFFALRDFGPGLSYLYVAMSRPRAGLWIALHRSFEKQIREKMITQTYSPASF